MISVTTAFVLLSATSLWNFCLCDNVYNSCVPNPNIYWHSGEETGFPVGNVLINNDPCTDPNNVWLNDNLKPFSQFKIDMGCLDNFDTIQYRQIPYAPIPADKHIGIGKYKIWVSDDKDNWWVVREGEFPAYGPKTACGDQQTYTVNIGNEPKRYIWVEGLKNWGNGGGLAFFGLSKST